MAPGNGSAPIPAPAKAGVGTRTILAIRLDHVEVGSDAPQRRRILSRAEAEAEGWFDEPPCAVAERVFDENDIEGCSAELEKKSE